MVTQRRARRGAQIVAVLLSIGIVSVCAPVAATTFQITATPQDGAPVQYMLDTSYGTYAKQSDGTYKWDCLYTPPSNKFTLEMHLVLDPDPGISGPVTITNNFGVTATFSSLLTLPVLTPLPAGSPMQGSSSITISDANLNTVATLSAPAGSAVYHAQVDGIDQRTLFPAAYSLSPPLPVAGGTNSETRAFTGEFTTSALTSEIGIRHHLTLTAGDAATANSTFVVVPEPTARALGLLSAIGLIALRNGRRN